MKKFKLFGILIAAVCFSSCLFEDENLFDKSASERMSEEVAKYYSILTDSQYGWALEYFPDSKQVYGGFNYTVSFSKDKATVASELSEDQNNPGNFIQESSLYKITNDYGPVLTFDTYNSIMHFFADPSSSRPDAYKGDYEFILMSYKDGVVELKGKKTGNSMRLVKLTESYSTYLTKVVNSRQRLSNLSRLGLSLGSGDLIAVKKSDSKLTLGIEQDGNAIESAYIPTVDGFKFYKPIVISGKSLDRFVFDTDGKLIVSDQDKTVSFKIFNSFNDKFSALQFPFKIDITGLGMCDELWTSLSAAFQKNMDEYGFDIRLFTMGLNPIYPKYENIRQAFYINTGGYPLSYGIVISAYGFTEDQVLVELSKPGVNWSFFNWFLPPFKLIADKSPYKLTPDSSDNPTKVKLTSVADPTFWFDIQK